MYYSTLTRREEHAQNLSIIRDICGETYFRRMTYAEADSWLSAYEHMHDEGYPKQVAAERAWDFYCAGRRASV
jgi:hypothetical protein